MDLLTDDRMGELDYQERARRLALMLTARPERLDMDSWAGAETANECGTSACVAGWAVIWNSGAVSIDAEGIMTWNRSPEARPLWDVHPGSSWFRAGKVLLGLSDMDAAALFYGTGSSKAVAILTRIGSGELGNREGDVHVAVYFGK